MCLKTELKEQGIDEVIKKYLKPSDELIAAHIKLREICNKVVKEISPEQLNAVSGE